MKINYYLPMVAFLLFVILAFSTLYGASVSIENAVYDAMKHIQGAFGDWLFSGITQIFDSMTFLILCIVLLVLLWGAKRKKDMWLALSVLLGGSIIGEVLKIAFAKARPAGYLFNETGYSFPSGHALKGTIFLLLVIYLYKDQIKDIRWRRFFIIVCWVIAILVMLSRIYLGVHWLGDVLGGFFLGLGWFSLMLQLFGKDK